MAVFVSGHTHAPALSRFDRGEGKEAGVVVNSGCWLRQLQPMKARFHMPAVFFNRFVQTHVRVYLKAESIMVELFEHPRPSPQAMRLIERLATAGRAPPEPPAGSAPKVRAAAILEGAAKPVA
jgi:hypothetical protein